MKTKPYFYTEKGNFEFSRVIYQFGNTPLLMFVEHLESKKMYLSSACNDSLDRYSEIPQTYILVPLTQEEYQDLYDGKMTVNLPFLNAKENGFKITVQSQDAMDLISEFDASNNCYHHIPRSNTLKVAENDLPF